MNNYDDFYSYFYFLNYPQRYLKHIIFMLIIIIVFRYLIIMVGSLFCKNICLFIMKNL